MKTKPDKVQMERRKKAQYAWDDHTLELRVSGNRRKNPHDYSQTSKRKLL